MDDERRPGGLTRRRLLELGMSAAAIGAVDPFAVARAGAASARWPQGSLAAADARRVNPGQFMPLSQLRAWTRQLDAVGLRATATRAHEHYIDVLRSRLEQVGVKQLHFDAVRVRRWTTNRWSLHVVSGPGTGAARTASYIPYSGSTPPHGVTAPLAVLSAGQSPMPGSLAGKIVIFDVPVTKLSYSVFGALAYEQYDPAHVLTADGIYSRPWLGSATVSQLLDQLPASGAVGAIGVLALPADAAHGSYFPYDGRVRSVPGLYVDAGVGAQLKQTAAAGGSVRLTLEADVRRVNSRNLLGVIPGASPELMILNCHTDGPNAIEDNGPDAIVAISQYLARLPRRALPRTILVLLTTGHFVGGAGANAFVADHHNDLVRRTAAAVTIEHLGAREWLPQPNGRTALTGNAEPGTFFTIENHALVNASLDALRRAQAGPASVLRPFIADPRSPDGGHWPAEGEQLWSRGAIPTTNYITGPTYLLNWGIPTVDKIDFARARREAIAFTQLLLDLSHVPKATLRSLNIPRA